MASSRILADPVRSHFLTQRFFHSQPRLFAVPRLRIPARRARVSVYESKTVLISTLPITSQSNAVARLSRSPRFNFPPPFQPPFQSRLLHNGQSPSFWDRWPSFLPLSVVVVCGSCFIYAQWAQDQSEHHDNDTHVENIRRNFGSSLTNYREGRWWTLLTPSIMHISGMHLLVNMFVLLNFGRTVGRLLGPGAFVITWVGAGVFSSATSLIYEKIREKTAAEASSSGSFDRDSTDGHQSKPGIGIGASGSIVGMLALVTCMVPRIPMYLMMIPIPIPAWRLLAGGAAFSLAALQFEWLPGYGHAANLGGALFGVLYGLLLRGRGLSLLFR